VLLSGPPGKVLENRVPSPDDGHLLVASVRCYDKALVVSWSQLRISPALYLVGKASKMVALAACLFSGGGGNVWLPFPCSGSLRGCRTPSLPLCCRLELSCQFCRDKTGSRYKTSIQEIVIKKRFQKKKASVIILKKVTNPSFPHQSFP